MIYPLAPSLLHVPAGQAVNVVAYKSFKVRLKRKRSISSKVSFPQERKEL